MTKRDYKKFAEMFKFMVKRIDRKEFETQEDVASAMLTEVCGIFRDDNSNFSPMKFIQACSKSDK